LSRQISERTLVFLLGAIQFVNVLDFMMVTPLGPDFARELGIPTSQLGIIGGSYAAAASIAGFFGTFFLDRFDRRRALGVALLGLVLGTAAGGFAVGFQSLILARVVAGLFGGPATSLALSILTDLIPAERRGRAFGAVMGAFSVASVLGVPIGLWLSRHGGWRTPFFAVAGLGLCISAACITILPPVRAHLERLRSATQPDISLFALVSRKEVTLAFLSIATTMMSSFLIIPNFPAYLQYNCGVPRSHMEHLFAIGGVCSFITMRLVGRLVDRHGSPVIATVGTSLYIVNLAVGYLFGHMLLPAEIVMAVFMVSQSARNIAATTLSSKVPLEHERARYQSALSAVQHIASAAGAFIGALVLTELPDHSLSGITRLTAFAMVLSAMHPILLTLIDRQLRRRDAQKLASAS
jgi:predicted MFS family arabinose efflux permease